MIGKWMQAGVMSVALAAPLVLMADQHGHDHAQPQTPQQQAPGGAGSAGMKGQGGMGMMRQGGMDMMAALDLNAQQRKQMRDIQRKLHGQQWEAMGKVMEARADLHEAMQAERPDPAAVGKAHERMAQLMRPIIEARVKAANEMQAVLTDEQRAKLRRMGGGMGMMGSGMMGGGMGMQGMDGMGMMEGMSGAP